MNDDKAFQEWLKVNYMTAGGAPLVAAAAWKAALEHASKLAFDTAKRYTCKTRRGICFAIADQINKG